MWIAFLLFSLLGFGSEIELFCDWESKAKGTQLFPILEGVSDEDLSMPSLLRKKLIANGVELKSWEIEKYRPWLLRFSGLESFSDLKMWLTCAFKKKHRPLTEAKYWMFWNLGPNLRHINLSKVPSKKLILIMWEPPTIQPELYDPSVQAQFGKIFTWDDDLVDQKKFFKIHYPELKKRIEEIPQFDQKRFCVMICRRLTSKHPKELYSKRKEMIKFFENKPLEDFDFYGFWWKSNRYKNYKGSCKDKIDTLKNYKFSICYENMRDVKGYITEKIFDCFAAGVVPVYWGASNITDYVPKECFIDRREFQSNEELYQFLKTIDREAYERYLNAAWDFLKSKKAHLFTNEFFVEGLVPHLTGSFN